MLKSNLQLREKSLAVQWLGLGAFTVTGRGSIPGWGTKIPQAVWLSQRKKTVIYNFRRTHDAKYSSCSEYVLKLIYYTEPNWEDMYLERSIFLMPSS